MACSREYGSFRLYLLALGIVAAILFVLTYELLVLLSFLLGSLLAFFSQYLFQGGEPKIAVAKLSREERLLLGPELKQWPRAWITNSDLIILREQALKRRKLDAERLEQEKEVDRIEKARLRAQQEAEGERAESRLWGKYTDEQKATVWRILKLKAGILPLEQEIKRLTTEAKHLTATLKATERENRRCTAENADLRTAVAEECRESSKLLIQLNEIRTTQIPVLKEETQSLKERNESLSGAIKSCIEDKKRITALEEGTTRLQEQLTDHKKTRTFLMSALERCYYSLEHQGVAKVSKFG